MPNEVAKKVWPEWKVEKPPLGRGTYGVVYKAVRREYNMESRAAIKVIHISADSSEINSLRAEGLSISDTRTYFRSLVDSFVGEIQLMESLKGVQNIVSVEDYKVVEKNDGIGWDIYIRMELLTPFNSYICDKKMTEVEVIKLGCDICTALEICAKCNIIHRDIKPENIFINDFGDFKLGDFGIARKLENMAYGMSQKGTPCYMAPEIVKGNEYDGRVDIYSLGVVLYRMLNGNRIPFIDSKKQILGYDEKRNAIDRRLRGEKLPVPSEASPAMADLILRACAYEPDERFASAMEMKQALMRVTNGIYRTDTNNKSKVVDDHKREDNYNRAGAVSRTPEKDFKERIHGFPNSTDKTVAVRKVPKAFSTEPLMKVETFGGGGSTKCAEIEGRKPSAAILKLRDFLRNDTVKKDKDHKNIFVENPDIQLAYGQISAGQLKAAEAHLLQALETSKGNAERKQNHSDVSSEYDMEIAKICVGLGVLYKEIGQEELSGKYYSIERKICQKYAENLQQQNIESVNGDYFDEIRRKIGITDALGTNRYVEHLLCEEIYVYRLLCQSKTMRCYQKLCVRLQRYGRLLEQTSRLDEALNIYNELLGYYKTTLYDSREIHRISRKVENIKREIQEKMEEQNEH